MNRIADRKEAIIEMDFLFLSIDFPREVIRGESLFTNMVIDATTSLPSNNCDDVFIYITDTVEPGTNTTLKWVDFVIEI